MNDHKDTALVIDMRSQKNFSHIQLEKSVNFAIEKFNEESFFNWTKVSKTLETDTSIFKTKSTQNAYKRRRRFWVYIIPANSHKNLKQTLLEVCNFASKEGMKKLTDLADTPDKQEDLLSLRNALLLYKALKLERLRELDICLHGFDKFVKYYKHFCLDQKQELFIPRP